MVAPASKPSRAATDGEASIACRQNDQATGISVPAALGIPPGTAAQEAVNRLYAISRALDGGQASADPATAARLMALPALPQTAAAAASAAEALRSRNSQGQPIR